ncbi:MAG: chemotaxis response regulator protein-glutamate methylesterase [Gammaproteobacteria bacterium]|nr:MAG: chemotaxis response regulator protein-glutamate methylesterase [Gammaproteobacteria bacterium]
MAQVIKVLVVDDSPLIRALLKEIINSQPDMEVVGEAADPYEARSAIKALNPDVLTLDVEMPRMDGITFLRNLMRLRPMPVIMISTLTQKGSQVTLDALEIGALDYVPKPSGDLREGLDELADAIRAKVRMAARVSPDTLALRQKRLESWQNRSAPEVAKRATSGRQFPSDSCKLIALGASTGGLDALTTVLSGLGENVPGIVMTQHIPAGFSASFAARLNGKLPLEVLEAREGLEVLPGRAILAEGDHHLRVEWTGQGYICRLDQGAKVSRHRPSVDVLFESVAQAAGKHAIAALLTGMGEDGARGMLKLKQAGAWTIAQDEASSVVWGMPGAAVRLGAVREVKSLDEIARSLLAWAHQHA